MAVIRHLSSRADARTSLLVFAIATGLTGLALLVPGVLPVLVSSFHAPSGPGGPATYGTQSDTLIGKISVSLGGPRSPLSPAFWGADVRVYYSVGSTQAGLWDATPLGYARWPGGAVADGYNFSANVITNVGGSTFSPPQDERMFVSWCRTVHCQAIFQVPAEINEPTTAAYYVAYTEQTLGFHPAYWEIGNEPGLWQRFGVPWDHWGTTPGQTISPALYAQVVHAYIAAMKAVDPTLRFIGLPGTGLGGSGETTWLTDTVQTNGPNLSAVAIHVYPAGRGPANGATLSDFLGTLYGKGTLNHRIPLDRQAVAQACPTCGPIPIFVTEFGSGISGGTYDGYMGAYPQVPYIAASLVQGITLNVTNIDLFSFQAAYPGSLLYGSGGPHPLYWLYADLLSNFGSIVVPAPNTFGSAGVFSVATLDSSAQHAILFVVNANATHPIAFELSGMPLNGSGTIWSWNASTSTPVVQNVVGPLPATWAVPAASLLMLRTSVESSGGGSPPPTYPVRFTEAGLPAGSEWAVAINGSTSTAVVSTIQVVLGNGTYPYSVAGPSGYSASPSAGTVMVRGGGVNVSIIWTPTGGAPSPTWNVTFVPVGLPLHTTWSAVLGQNVSSSQGSIAFAVGAGSYAFSILAPSGFSATPHAGTVNVTHQNVTVPVQLSSSGSGSGPPATFPVTFVESGLPAGTLWSITASSIVSTRSSQLELNVSNGSYTYTVNPVSGFVASPDQGAFTIGGAPLTIVLAFLSNHSVSPPGETGSPPPAVSGAPPIAPWGIPVAVLLLTAAIVLFSGVLAGLVLPARRRRSKAIPRARAPARGRSPHLPPYRVGPVQRRPTGRNGPTNSASAPGRRLAPGHRGR